MRVTFNSYVNIAQPILNRQGTIQATLERQISSGQSISEASDDPLTANRILNLQAQTTQAQQTYQNAGYALNISTASYSAINTISQISGSISTIAISGADPITGPASASANAAQVNQLLEEAVTAGNQQFNGSYLLGGTKTDTPPFTATRDASGQITGVTYTGAASGASIPLGNNSSVSPFTDGATNSSLADFMNQLVSLRNSLTSGDTSAVSALQPALTQSGTKVIDTLGQLGALQAGMQSMQDAASSTFTTMSAQMSQDDNVNVAQAATALTQSQTAYQAAIATEAKVMSKSLLDYIT